MKNIWMVLMAVVFLTACNSGGENADLAATQKAIDGVHDEAMAMYGTLQFSEEAFSQFLIDAKDDSTVLKGHSMKEVETVLEQLEKSFKGMNNWMSNTKDLKSLTEMDDERKMKFLATELQSITSVNDQTKDAIAAAQELATEIGLNIKGLSTDSHDGHDHDHDGEHSHDDEHEH